MADLEAKLTVSFEEASDGEPIMLLDATCGEKLIGVAVVAASAEEDDDGS